jgi:hypothetical protein
MKKLNVLFFAIAAMAIGFTSCKPSEPAVPPTLTISPSTEQLAAVGATVTFTLNCSSDVELKTLAVSASTVGGTNSMFQDNAAEIESKTATEITFVNSNMSATGIKYDYVVPAGLATGTIVTLTFTLTDKDANATITGTVKVGTVAPVIVEYTGKTLTYTSTNLTDNNIINVADGSLLNGGGAVADMDLVFAYNGTAGIMNTISSPNSTWLASAWFQTAWTATGKNNTEVMAFTGDYAAATSETISALTITGEDVHALAAGSMVAFQTADGYKGILKVTTAKITESIVVDLKVVAPAATK